MLFMVLELSHIAIVKALLLLFVNYCFYPKTIQDSLCKVSLFNLIIPYKSHMSVWSAVFEPALKHRLLMDHNALAMEVVGSLEYFAFIDLYAFNTLPRCMPFQLTLVLNMGIHIERKV